MLPKSHRNLRGLKYATQTPVNEVTSAASATSPVTRSLSWYAQKLGWGWLQTVQFGPSMMPIMPDPKDIPLVRET